MSRYPSVKRVKIFRFNLGDRINISFCLIVLKVLCHGSMFFLCFGVISLAISLCFTCDVPLYGILKDIHLIILCNKLTAVLVYAEILTPAGKRSIKQMPKIFNVINPLES